VHLYQIWLFPERKGLEPSYEQKRFPESERRNRPLLIASRDAAEGSLRIHCNAQIYLATLDDGRAVNHALAEGRHAWLQVLRGQATLNGHALATSDGAAVSGESGMIIQAHGGAAEVMLFDLD
jgi:redox-sensitive bicupin YhaK (pirin superfamily)